MSKKAKPVKVNIEGGNGHWDVWAGPLHYSAEITAITSYNMGVHEPDGYRVDFNGESYLRDHFQSAKSVAIRLVRGEKVNRYC